MKIGFDAKRAFNNRTGLGNYSRFVIKSLSDFYSENEYFAYTPKISDQFGNDFIPQIKDVKLILPENFIYKKLGGYWRSFHLDTLLQNDKIDIYHGLSNELPSSSKTKKYQSIVTIHDLIFLRYPELYPFIDRKIYNWKFKNACISADKIIAVSSITKEDIIKHYQISPNKIYLSSMSCSSRFFKKYNNQEKENILKKYNIKDDFLLCVATLEERKNQMLIIKAIKLLSKENTPKLVLVGRKTKYVERLLYYIDKENLQSRVQLIHNVDNVDLPAIYQSASIFIYPSVYEGFGIPILEAMQSGVPIITTEKTTMQEIGQDACLYCNPNDENLLASQIKQLLSSKTLQKELISKGNERVKKYSPEVIVKELMEIYMR
ncbi:MAG: glycosyltransferase family 1 protein [Flammeovirgaceae bacterium]